MATSEGQLHIDEGDLVIVFVSRDRTPTPLRVTQGEQLVNLFGSFAHDDMIGLPFGSKIVSRNKKGFVYLLRPTPDLWTLSLPHRTQILYAPDMAFITCKLNLTPGAAVIEAGTGSGSFTHVLARTVARARQTDTGQTTGAWKGVPRDAPAIDSPIGEAPAPGPFDGRVWSFEFHSERVRCARTEFAAHGLDRTVSLQHRNVCKDGFGVDHLADAIFLDLPAPWEAVPHAAAALRSDTETRICCFSPCIEQVLRTVTALSECGFTDVTMYETLVRTHESITNIAPLEPISAVVNRIRANERKREKRREMQIANSRLEREKRDAEKAARIEGAAEPAEPTEVTEIGQRKRKAPVNADVHAVKRHNAGTLAADAADGESDAVAPAAAPADLAESPSGAPDDTADPPREMLYSAGFRQKSERRRIEPANVYSRPFPTMRGHTSYLTFASLMPRT